MTGSQGPESSKTSSSLIFLWKLNLWYFIDSVFGFFQFAVIPFSFVYLSISLHFLVFPCISCISFAVRSSTHLNPAVCGRRHVCPSGKCVCATHGPPPTRQTTKAVFALFRTRSLGAIRALTSSWRPFGPLAFVLCAV